LSYDRLDQLASGEIYFGGNVPLPEMEAPKGRVASLYRGQKALSGWVWGLVDIPDSKLLHDVYTLTLEPPRWVNLPFLIFDL